MPWRCPRCRGPLDQHDSTLNCAACAARYDVVAGIPDLRIPCPAWIDFEADKAHARRVADALESHSVETVVGDVFRARPGWSEARVQQRTRQILEGPGRARQELATWLAPVATGDRPLLEIGCGTGGLLAALPTGREAIGVDVSMVWLVVARRMLLDHGRRPVLAAAVAEALPLPSDAVDAAVALDVVEHVGDLPKVLQEIDRVCAPGAFVACATPNRFSLAPEPHVGVWGVGWLPRRLQARYVRWRSGEEYRFVSLLSPREALRLAARHTRIDARAEAPPVPAEEIATFRGLRRRLALTYNRIHAVRPMARLLLLVGPFFHLTGRKAG